MRLYLKRIFCVAVAMMLFVASAMATSCFPKREVRGLGVSIEGVSHVSHLSTSGMNLWLDVKNERGRIVVNRAKVEIAVDGVKQLELSLREKVVVRGPRGDKKRSSRNARAGKVRRYERCACENIIPN